MLLAAALRLACPRAVHAVGVVFPGGFSWPLWPRKELTDPSRDYDLTYVQRAQSSR